MKRQRGFTLLELLAAAALFSVLGVLLFQMVRSAMDVWSTGERNRELVEHSFAKLPADPAAAARVGAYPDSLSCTAR